MQKVFDYDRLTQDEQIGIADRIKEDNLEKSNQFYPTAIPRHSFYSRYGKRIIDIVISFFALLFSFPINLIIGLITYLDVGFPLFFKQERMGINCKPFTMIKFRNMTNKTDENGVLLRADLRVTKWGSFVRSTSLDELLNFINVFKGEMSIIGPRPLPVVYNGRFNHYHELRHAVKPGLDCPLQDPSKPMTWENRLNNDAWYAQNISFSNDLKLVILLVREALFSKDKQARSEGFNEGSFMGYFSDGRVMNSNQIPEKYYKEYISQEENA